MATWPIVYPNSSASAEPIVLCYVGAQQDSILLGPQRVFERSSEFLTRAYAGAVLGDAAIQRFRWGRRECWLALRVSSTVSEPGTNRLGLRVAMGALVPKGRRSSDLGQWAIASSLELLHAHLGSHSDPGVPDIEQFLTRMVRDPHYAGVQVTPFLELLHKVISVPVHSRPGLHRLGA